MLQTFRRFTQGLGFKILLVLLVGSFAVWGIGDIFRSNPMQEPVLEVGDVSISAEKFENQLRLDLIRANFEFQRQLTLPQAIELGLKAQTLESLKQQAIFNQETDRLGLTVSPDRVARELHADPQFLTPEGSFNQDLFQRMLSEMRLSEQDYLALLQHERAREQMVVGLAGAVQAPERLATLLYESRQEKRGFVEIAVAAGDFPPPQDPGDGALLRFYQDHAALFQRPEQRDVSLLLLAVDKLADSLAVADADVRAAYEARHGEFVEPEKRDFQQVLFADKESATAFYQTLKPETDFAAAAKDSGAEATALESYVKADLPAGLQDAAFALKLREFSAPLQSPLGWHVLLLQSVAPERILTFTEAKDRLTAELKLEKVAGIFQERLNAIDDALASGQDITHIAEQNDIALRTLRALRQDQPVFPQDFPESLRQDPSWVASVFASEAGQNSALIELKNGDYLAFRVESVQPSRLPEFDSLRPEVLAAWQKAQQEDRARQRAEKMVSDLAAGKNLDVVLAEPPVMKAGAVQEIERFGNNETALSTPDVARLFTLLVGQGFVREAQDGLKVVVLRSIAPARAEDSITGVETMRSRVADELRNAMMAELSLHLQKRTPVTVHERVLNKIGAEVTE